MEVSVIIPVYNAEFYIRQAVLSAIAHKEVREIILVEDASPDNSLQECYLLQKEFDKVKLFQHPNGTNKGAGASRNLGIEKSTKKFICFLDADDFFLPNRFAKEREIFSNIPEADGVYGALGAKYYDQTGGDVWEKRGFNEKHLDTVNKHIPPEYLFDFLIGFKNNDQYSGWFNLDALTLKRYSIIRSKISFNESLRLHQDTVFIWQCAYYLKLYAGEIVKPVAIRGIHKDNRYINYPHLRESRSKMYLSLIDWVKKDCLGKQYLELFKRKYYQIQLHQLNWMSLFLHSCLFFFFDAYFRKLRINRFKSRYIPNYHKIKK
jgi:glycosyltransferase involved in cell wall biosynthesis